MVLVIAHQLHFYLLGYLEDHATRRRNLCVKRFVQYPPIQFHLLTLNRFDDHASVADTFKYITFVKLRLLAWQTVFKRSLHGTPHFTIPLNYLDSM